MHNYPNSNFEQLEDLLKEKLERIPGFINNNYATLNISGYRFLLYQTQKGIEDLLLGNQFNPQNIVGAMQYPFDTIVIADRDCEGSGCYPKIQLIKLVDDVFQVAYISVNEFYEIKMFDQDSNGANKEIVCLNPALRFNNDNMNAGLKFPSIFRWDGKQLIDTTFSHKEYLLSWYKQIIDDAESESDDDAEEVERQLEFVNALDNCIKKYSIEGDRFWRDNLQEMRTSYNNWRKVKANAH